MNPDSKQREAFINVADLPRHTHYLALSCAVVVAILFFSLPADGRYQTTGPQILPLTLPDASQAILASESSGEDGQTEGEHWRTATVRPGDSLYAIFSRLGLGTEDLYRLLDSSDDARALEQVRPGQQFRIRTNTQGELLELVHQADRLEGLTFLRTGNTFEVIPYNLETETRTALGSGVIRGSLYQSAMRAGLSDKIVMELAEIFGWDIDFALDIRPGDRFAIVYEEHYLDGDKVGDGHILAAEFTNRGKTYRAVRYTTARGKVHYYTPEGKAMRQAFLRTPVDFRRISSHFQPNRWHPVLGVKRPHMGTDYAAPTGTPIKAAGDGVVTFRGRKGGYGNTIIIQHGKRYSTLYAHMSGFANSLSRGDKVEQGQIIGYVGATGLATGPHLHYEFRIDGKHVNPVTVDLPGQMPMPEEYRDDFHRKAAPVVTQLNNYIRLALGPRQGKDS